MLFHRVKRRQGQIISKCKLSFVRVRIIFAIVFILIVLIGVLLKILSNIISQIESQTRFNRDMVLKTNITYFKQTLI